MENVPPSQLALIPSAPTSPISIEILPLEPEDCATWQIQHYTCYNDHMQTLLALRPFSGESWESIVEGRKKELTDPGVRIFKAVDTSTEPPTLAAIAKWTVHVDSAKRGGNVLDTRAGDAAVEKDVVDTTPVSAPLVHTAYTAKVQKPESASFAHTGPPPELNLPLLHAFLTPLRDTCKEVMAGKEYVMLNSLTTFKVYQRKGIGRQLMQWGLDRADELDVDFYLDSSPAARSLYESCGFEQIRAHVFDMEPWGGYEGEKHYTYTYIRKRKSERESAVV